MVQSYKVSLHGRGWSSTHHTTASTEQEAVDKVLIDMYGLSAMAVYTGGESWGPYEEIRIVGQATGRTMRLSRERIMLGVERDGGPEQLRK